MALREYRYKAELKYINGNNEINITTESINFICIDSDYLGKKAFPIIYIGINLKASIYNTMLENIKEDTVVLSMTKYTVDEDGGSTVESKFIKDEFIYFFNETDPDYNQDLEKASSEGDIDSTSGYKRVKMGLLNLNILNLCKTMYNDIISGKMSSILYYYLKDASSIIMQKLDNNKEFDKLIIPPLPTLNKLLQYLNNISSFYNTSYRFFIDLNKRAYLLSNNGDAVPAKDEMYSSIIVKVSSDIEDSTSKEPGIEIDSKNQCYNLYLDSSNTSTTINLYKDKEVSKIITISTNGIIKSSKLDTFKNSTGIRTNIYRTFNENNKEIQNIAHLTTSGNVMLNITKEGVDCSLITPNKSINVKNHKLYKEYDGKYILAGKQEIFVMNDMSNFTCNTILKMLKIKS